MKNAEEYFASARERHAIYLRRSAGLTAPYTQDQVFLTYRFCNVFRELDRTTTWFRENVREPLRATPQALLATVLFRWFNRISTGQGLFCQKDIEAESAFALYQHTGKPATLKRACVAINGKAGPHVTGSYVVLGKRGMPKMEGVVEAFHDFAKMKFKSPVSCGEKMVDWKTVANELLEWNDSPRATSLETVWAWLKEVPYLGPFMAYEIVSDLRHTDLLCNAPDIMTWANPGPGAARGLSRVRGDYRGDQRIGGAAPATKAAMLEQMRELLELSRSPKYWPQTKPSENTEHAQKMRTNGYKFTESALTLGDWPAWEMRDVEHWLCEHDKKVRTELGQGRPRQKFKGV